MSSGALVRMVPSPLLTRITRLARYTSFLFCYLRFFSLDSLVLPVFILFTPPQPPFFIYKNSVVHHVLVLRLGLFGFQSMGSLHPHRLRPHET